MFLAVTVNSCLRIMDGQAGVCFIRRPEQVKYAAKAAHGPHTGRVIFSCPILWKWAEAGAKAAQRGAI